MLRPGVGGRIIELFLVFVVAMCGAIIIIVHKEQTSPFLLGKIRI
jgi:hypothetical protein